MSRTNPSNIKTRCVPCDKSFLRKSDLDRHLRAIHCKPQFRCVESKCARHKKPFSRMDRLRDHMRIRHPTLNIVVAQAQCNRLAGPADNARDENVLTEWPCQTEIGHNQSNQGIHLPFACPYYKWDRQTHQSRPCIGPGWVELHRLKEHLYRCHRQSIKCQTCSQSFENNNAFLMHLHSSSDCSLRDETVTPGFTEEQERQLRCRYRAPKEQTQEDKWYTIYSILFPNANPSQYPSPYYDQPVDCHGQFQFTGRELLDEYDKFLSSELPKSILGKIALKFLLSDKLDSEGMTLLEAAIKECHTELSQIFMTTASLEPLKQFAIMEASGPLSTENLSATDPLLGEWPF